MWHTFHIYVTCMSYIRCTCACMWHTCHMYETYICVHICGSLIYVTYDSHKYMYVFIYIHICFIYMPHANDMYVLHRSALVHVCAIRVTCMRHTFARIYAVPSYMWHTTVTNVCMYSSTYIYASNTCHMQTTCMSYIGVRLCMYVPYVSHVWDIHLRAYIFASHTCHMQTTWMSYIRVRMFIYVPYVFRRKKSRSQTMNLFQLHENLLSPNGSYMSRLGHIWRRSASNLRSSEEIAFSNRHSRVVRLLELRRSRWTPAGQAPVTIPANFQRNQNFSIFRKKNKPGQLTCRKKTKKKARSKSV